MSGQLTLINSNLKSGEPRDCWRTPPELFALLDARYHFVCDVASDDDNRLVRNGRIIKDALTEPWPINGWCFLNPPFSMLLEFLREVCNQVQKLNGKVIVLVPGHRHDQCWWHRYVINKAESIMVPRGRIAYIPAPGIKCSSPSFPSFVLRYQNGVKHRTRMEAL